MLPTLPKVSAGGRVLIRTREGYKLEAYYDSEGILTIGVGHTGRMAPPAVTPGMRITDAQCDAFLAADLAPVEVALAKVIKVKATQNQIDAMASWLFNVGVGYATAHETIIARLNAGDVQGAAAGFDLFHKPAEIIGRRNSEKAQFLTPDGAALPAHELSPSPAADVSAARPTSKPAAHPRHHQVKPAAAPSSGVFAGFLRALFGV